MTYIDKTAIVEKGSKIGKNTKIWHFTHVMPTANIGENVSIGQNCFIGDNVKIQGQSGVISNIKENSTIQGTPAFSYNDYNKSYVYFKNLPNILKEINRIIKKLDL